MSALGQKRTHALQYNSLVGGFGRARRQPVADKDAKSSRSLKEDGLVATRPIVSRRCARHCERDRRAARAAGEDLMHGVGQLDQHFVLTGRQSDHGDRIDVTRVRPQAIPPGWRSTSAACSEYPHVSSQNRRPRALT